MATQTVFISCGQQIDAERALGTAIARLVEELTPFRGYFAQEARTLEGLTHSILEELSRAVAFICVMHHRGRVTTLPNGDLHSDERASVWIEQEIGIAAFMQQILRRDIRVAAFQQKGLRREGIRDLIHLNPIDFVSNDEVLVQLREILPSWRSIPAHPSADPYYLEPADGDVIRKDPRVAPSLNTSGEPQWVFEHLVPVKRQQGFDYVLTTDGRRCMNINPFTSRTLVLMQKPPRA
jgi:hypothetical protein